MIIYAVTNLINGKMYIGQTSRTLEQRWREHCSSNSGCRYLHGALSKYGRENFKVEQIDVALDREEANRKESFYIERYNTIAPHGYNLNSGGGVGRSVSEETIAKLRENHADVSGERNPMYGKIRPEVGIRNKELKGRAVSQYTKDGQKIATYSTINEAKRITGIDAGWICGVCCKKYGYKTAGGYVWRYADEVM